jgi:predicted dehydrogenase
LQTVRIAVIGAGYWGTKLAHEYSLLSKSTNGVFLNSIVDSSQERLKVLKSQLGNDSVSFCSDYREVLKDSGIDAVHIALPNNLHYETARMALESGKHVLVEKPMTTSSREALKLATLSEEKGLVLQVGHIFRFNNALRKVGEIMRQGVLGKILYASLAWASYIEPPTDRDIVFDLAPHPIDVLNYVLEEWPITVNAMGRSCLRNQAGREEVAFINLRFPDSVLANVYVSWIDHGRKERSVQLVGEKASLKCDALNQTVTISTREQQPRETQVQANNTIRDMQLHFIDRIRGRGPQFNSPLIGATTVQVLEAIVHSMMSRSCVNLSFL